jgi:D-hexose-6-phosphate mutarotase
MRSTQALHTYYRVSDISDVQLEGLQEVPFFDNTDSRRKKDGDAGDVVIAGEVDRIYAHGREFLLVFVVKLSGTAVVTAHAIVVMWSLHNWMFCTCELCTLLVLASSMGWSNTARSIR